MPARVALLRDVGEMSEYPEGLNRQGDKIVKGRECELGVLRVLAVHLSEQW